MRTVFWNSPKKKLPRTDSEISRSEPIFLGEDRNTVVVSFISESKKHLDWFDRDRCRPELSLIFETPETFHRDNVGLVRDRIRGRIFVRAETVRANSAEERRVFESRRGRRARQQGKFKLDRHWNQGKLISLMCGLIGQLFAERKGRFTRPAESTKVIY